MFKLLVLLFIIKLYACFNILKEKIESNRKKEENSRVWLCEINDIDILITSRNGYRVIMQSIRIARGLPTRIRERNQSSQFR